MCGRYTLVHPSEIVNDAVLAQRQAAAHIAHWLLEPRYNIGPQQQILTVVGAEGGRELRVMRWGFQPGWFKPSSKVPPPFNARSESLVERPMFRGAVRSARCLIPADGFYEWKVVEGQKRKQPYYIRLRGNGVFYFAGLYTSARADETGEDTVSCAIVTCAPNELMAGIHNRMPVILTSTAAAYWSDPAVKDADEVVSLLEPCDADAMVVYPVSSAVSLPRNDGPELIEPLVADRF
jgi:putative SOS response-associated peptidase YedK